MFDVYYEKDMEGSVSGRTCQRYNQEAAKNSDFCFISECFVLYPLKTRNNTGFDNLVKPPPSVIELCILLKFLISGLS